MSREDRRAAVAAYKERKVPAGIYAVRCAASGECWAGAAPDLGTIQNRLWFGLRLGNSQHRTMQQAWRTHGGDSFSFEVIERLPEEEDRYFRDKQLRDRLAHWRTVLGAAAI